MTLTCKIKEIYDNEAAWAAFTAIVPLPITPEHGMWGLISNCVLEDMLSMQGEIPEAALAMINSKLNEFDNTYVEEE